MPELGALTQSLNFSISAPKMWNRAPFAYLYLFQLYILVSRTWFYPVFVKFPPCGVPSFTGATRHRERVKINREWYRFLGSALKARTRTGNKSGHFYSGRCPVENLSWKQDRLHIYLLDFSQTLVVIKTEVHDSEKIRFWSSSQNWEINASDQQKWQITLQ